MQILFRYTDFTAVNQSGNYEASNDGLLCKNAPVIPVVQSYCTTYHCKEIPRCTGVCCLVMGQCVMHIYLTVISVWVCFPSESTVGLNTLADISLSLFSSFLYSGTVFIKFSQSRSVDLGSVFPVTMNTIRWTQGI